MKVRLTGDPGQVDDTVAALEKTPWLIITKTSRSYSNRCRPYYSARPRVEQVRVYLDVEFDGAGVVDVVIGTRGEADLDIKTIDGRREAWVIIDEVGGYVCAEPDPGYPGGICGLPVESEPCSIHHPDAGGDG
jgi:hypothetical protein